MYPKVHDLTFPLPKVDVRVHCLYGTGKDTDEGYVYDVPEFDASGPPPPKKIAKGPGDGTVNLRSLEACRGCAQFLCRQSLCVCWRFKDSAGRFAGG